jgi:arginyl-tRNA synthetase
MVNLLDGGEQVTMSKRSGQFVTLKEILEEVGVDATRYFFLMRRSDSHLDFDLQLARSARSENPVYYAQYAHARICSIFREAESRGVVLPKPEEFDVNILATPEEDQILRKLALFPEEVDKAAREFAPHRIVYYIHDLATAFHSFYNAHRILGEASPLQEGRLLLGQAVRLVLANALRLLGVSAPEKM